MFKEALTFLSDQAVAAKGPHIASVDGVEPSHVYFLNGERKTAEPHPRAHVAKDLTAIVAFAKRELDAHDVDESTNNPIAVWYSAAGVVCFINDNTRRDCVYLPLAFSPQLKKILSWGEKSTPIKQRDLCLLLRTMFKRNLTQAPNLIDILRVLKFSQSSDVGSTVTSSKSSVGKRIESEVSGAASIPDEFCFNVPIFADPLGKMEGLIDVAIECDAGTESFTFHPMPGAAAKQIALAEASIGATLREAIGEGGANVVHYGLPSAGFEWTPAAAK